MVLAVVAPTPSTVSAVCAHLGNEPRRTVVLGGGQSTGCKALAQKRCCRSKVSLSILTSKISSSSHSTNVTQNNAAATATCAVSGRWADVDRRQLQTLPPFQLSYLAAN